MRLGNILFFVNLSLIMLKDVTLSNEGGQKLGHTKILIYLVGITAHFALAAVKFSKLRLRQDNIKSYGNYKRSRIVGGSE